MTGTCDEHNRTHPTAWEVGVVGYVLGISSSPLTAVVVMALRAGREHFTVSTRALSKVW